MQKNAETTSSKTQENGLDIGGIIIKTFVYTMLALVGLSMWLISITYVVDPVASIKVFDFLGAQQASLAAYERIYDKSNDNYDLYNLIQKTISIGQHKKTVKYIDELLSKEDYEAFVVKVNKETTDGIAKKYIALVGDLDGYLTSQKVVALYKCGRKEDALKLATIDVYNPNPWSFALSAYLDCLYADSSIADLGVVMADLKAYTFDNGDNLLEQILARREQTDYAHSDGTDVDAILRVYTCMKMDNALVGIYHLTGEEDLARECSRRLEALMSTYDSLV